MLASGRITAAEAVGLLDGVKGGAGYGSPPQSSVELKAAEAAIPDMSTDIAVEEFKREAMPPSDPFKIKITEDDLSVTKPNGERPRWLKIRVRDLGTGRNKVSVTLPIGFVSFGLGLARRFGADFDDDYNINDMWQMIKEGERGVLVDVEDEEDNEQVQIYLD
jgi:hypothetical protein